MRTIYFLLIMMMSAVCVRAQYSSIDTTISEKRITLRVDNRTGRVRRIIGNFKKFTDYGPIDTLSVRNNIRRYLNEHADIMNIEPENLIVKEIIPRKKVE